MDTPQRHKIRELVVELDTPWEVAFPKIQHRIQLLLEGEIKAKIEQWLDQFAPPDQLIHLGELELDLGELSEFYLERDFENHLEERILALLKEKLGKYKQAPKTPSQTAPKDWIKFYLEKGALPWWVNPPTAEEITAMVQEWTKEHFSWDHPLLRKHPTALQRILFHLPEKQWPQLFEQLPSARKLWLQQWWGNTTAKIHSLGEGSAFEMKAEAMALVRDWLLSADNSTDSIQQFQRQFQRGMESKFTEWSKVSPPEQEESTPAGKESLPPERIWKAMLAGESKGITPRDRWQLWQRLTAEQQRAQWTDPAFLQWLAQSPPQAMPDQWWESWEKMSVGGSWKQPTLFWDHWEKQLQPLESAQGTIPWLAMRKKFMREWLPRTVGNEAGLRQEILEWMLAEAWRESSASPNQWLTEVGNALWAGAEIPPFTPAGALELGEEETLSMLFSSASKQTLLPILRKYWAKWKLDGETQLPKGSLAQWAKALLGKQFKAWTTWQSHLIQSLPTAYSASPFHPQHGRYWLGVLEAVIFQSEKPEAAFLRQQWEALGEIKTHPAPPLAAIFQQNPWKISLPMAGMPQPIAEWEPAESWETLQERIRHWNAMPSHLKTGKAAAFTAEHERTLKAWEKEVQRIALAHTDHFQHPPKHWETLEMHWEQAYRAFWWHYPTRSEGETVEGQDSTPAETQTLPPTPTRDLLLQLLAISDHTGKSTIGKKALKRWAAHPRLPQLLAELDREQAFQILDWMVPHWVAPLQPALALWEKSELPQKAFWKAIFASILRETTTERGLTQAMQSLLAEYPEAAEKLSETVNAEGSAPFPWNQVLSPPQPAHSIGREAWEKWEALYRKHPQFSPAAEVHWQKFLASPLGKSPHLSLPILTEWAKGLKTSVEELAHWLQSQNPPSEGNRLLALLPAPPLWVSAEAWTSTHSFPSATQLGQLLEETEVLPTSGKKLDALWGIWSAQPGFFAWVKRIPQSLHQQLLRRLAPAHTSLVQSLLKDWKFLSVEIQGKAPEEALFWEMIWRGYADYRPSSALQQQWVAAAWESLGIFPTSYFELLTKASPSLQLKHWHAAVAKNAAPPSPAEPTEEWTQFLLHGKLLPGMELPTLKARLLNLARNHPKITRPLLQQLGQSAAIAHNIRLLFAESEWIELAAHLLVLPPADLQRTVSESRKWLQSEPATAHVFPHWGNQLLQLAWGTAAVRNLADVWEKSVLLTATSAKIPLPTLLLHLQKALLSTSLPLLTALSGSLLHSWRKELDAIQGELTATGEEFLRKQFPYHTTQLLDVFTLILRIIPPTESPKEIWEWMAQPQRKRRMAWEKWLEAVWKAMLLRWPPKQWAMALHEAWAASLPHFRHPQSARRLHTVFENLNLSTAPPEPVQAPIQWEDAEALPEIAVSYAGLVLMAPYLGRYFEVLGLMEKGQFKHAKARKRAVFLLIHLAGGKKPSEADLLLPKILCGLDWDEWLAPTAIRVKKNEAEMTESLLATAISYWKTLGTTSNETLQETFLQRKGTLAITEEKWILTVDPQSYDLLLRTIPWGISPVTLPWMKQLLHVEWKY